MNGKTNSPWISGSDHSRRARIEVKNEQNRNLHVHRLLRSVDLFAFLYFFHSHEFAQAFAYDLFSPFVWYVTSSSLLRCLCNKARDPIADCSIPFFFSPGSYLGLIDRVSCENCARCHLYFSTPRCFYGGGDLQSKGGFTLRDSLKHVAIGYVSMEDHLNWLI